MLHPPDPSHNYLITMIYMNPSCFGEQSIPLIDPHSSPKAKANTAAAYTSDIAVALAETLAAFVSFQR